MINGILNNRVITVDALCYCCRRIHQVTDYARCLEGIWSIDGYPVITCDTCRPQYKRIKSQNVKGKGMHNYLKEV